MIPEADLAATTELLNAELPDPRLVDTRYLHWLYEENPYGEAFQRSVDVDGRRVSHYACIPQVYRDAEEATPCAFSLNAVTRSGTQRQGNFVNTGLQIYADAAEAGRRFIIGVGNEKSAIAGVKHMGWKMVGPLPVKVCPIPGLGGGDVEHHRVDRDFLESDAFGRIVDGLEQVPAENWTNHLTPEYLRWRLASPHTSYCVHATDELVAVSTRDRRFGLPVAVVLKLAPRGGRSGPLDARRLVASICRFHRAPSAAYAGWNKHVRMPGFRPPRRLQPAPLIMVLRRLADDFDQEALELDTFELLDMDAY